MGVDLKSKNSEKAENLRVGGYGGGYFEIPKKSEKVEIIRVGGYGGFFFVVGTVGWYVGWYGGVVRILTSLNGPANLSLNHEGWFFKMPDSGP